MRRNRITILKCLLFICGFASVPILFKWLFLPDTVEENSAGNLPRYIANKQEWRRAEKSLGKRLFWFELDENGHPLGPSNLPPEQAIPQYIKKQTPDEDGKIDWHDYAKIGEELKRTGPGEGGTGVQIPPAEESKKQAIYAVNGFNGYASDKISLDRSIRDIRHPECHSQKYLSRLPSVSVVIPFHNEHWSSLLRNVHSIFNRSPFHLIKEVILTDDYSTKDFLKKDLDDYFRNKFDGKVKIVRATQREGLIRTRILGAKAATGDVLIFLDSHCEANVNWLPPLIEPIAEDYRTVVCPFIDVLDMETFEYKAQDEGARGAFDWEFFYKRLPLTQEDLKHPAKPFKSPVMAGGLFAISRKWFFEVGAYDPELQIWGGEQYELSFKIWQCGGMMVDAPCSRVGHVYRKFAPFPNNAKGDFVGRNYARVAEVWMDEYKEFLYKRRPQYRKIDAGDMREQLAVREKLKCKPFSWFMREVAWDLEKYYPTVEPPPFAAGEIRSVSSKLCIDTKNAGEQQTFGLNTCMKDKPGISGEQHFDFTWHKDIRPGPPPGRHMCFDVSTSHSHSPIVLYHCHGMQGNQLFKFNLATNQLFHPVSRQCVDHDADRKELFMSSCDSSAASQRWSLENMNRTALEKLWNEPLQ